jgi:hypothetical protein
MRGTANVRNWALADVPARADANVGLLGGKRTLVMNVQDPVISRFKRGPI